MMKRLSPLWPCRKMYSFSQQEQSWNCSTMLSMNTFDTSLNIDISDMILFMFCYSFCVITLNSLCMFSLYSSLIDPLWFTLRRAFRRRMKVFDFRRFLPLFTLVQHFQERFQASGKLSRVLTDYFFNLILLLGWTLFSLPQFGGFLVAKSFLFSVQDKSWRLTSFSFSSCFLH